MQTLYYIIYSLIHSIFVFLLDFELDYKQINANSAEMHICLGLYLVTMY